MIVMFLNTKMNKKDLKKKKMYGGEPWDFFLLLFRKGYLRILKDLNSLMSSIIKYNSVVPWNL